MFSKRRVNKKIIQILLLNTATAQGNLGYWVNIFFFFYFFTKTWALLSSNSMSMYMFLWRNKNINTILLKKALYLDLCTGSRGLTKEYLIILG